MDLETAIKDISQMSKRFPEEAFAYLRENKEESIPELIRLVKGGGCYDDDDDLRECCFAMYLLAEFKAKSALPVMLEYLEFDQDTLEETIGDGLTESFHKILADLSNGECDLPLFRFVIECPNNYAFARACATQALIALHVQGKLSREKIVSYFKYLLDNFSGDNDLMEMMCFPLGDLYDEALLEQYLAMIDLLENEYVNLRNEIAWCLKKGKDYCIQKTMNDNYNHPIDRAEDEILKIYSFSNFKKR